jgi:hypothetical protein
VTQDCTTCRANPSRFCTDPRAGSACPRFSRAQFGEPGEEAAEGCPPKWMGRSKYLFLIVFFHIDEKPAKHAALAGGQLREPARQAAKRLLGLNRQPSAGRQSLWIQLSKTPPSRA